ncbi:MAG: winged helix-turn-helix transcriptional regulator [Anaerolineales bacterium]
MTMTTSRQRVLNYLKKQRSASAAQIGRALNMSAATVRHHLSIMLSDGRITIIGAKRSGERGRPVKLYKLSEKYLGDNFALLSDAVLNEMLKKLSPAKQKEVIHAIAKRFALQFDANDLNFPMAKQLSLIIEKLNAYHYQARWEAGADGPRILFAHCPYAAIIEKHPELCQMDEILLGKLMNVTTHQLAKIDQQSAGSPYCIFRFN